MEALLLKQKQLVNVTYNCVIQRKMRAPGGVLNLSTPNAYVGCTGQEDLGL